MTRHPLTVHCVWPNSAAGLLVALCMLGMPATSVHAGGTLMLREIPDEALSEMRGRFIASGQIVYFGIEMVSRWQTQTGEAMLAAGRLVMDFRHDPAAPPRVGFRPTVALVTDNPTARLPRNTRQQALGSGFENVTGIAQSIQVAGNRNSVSNGIDMNVSVESSDSFTTTPAASDASALASIETKNGISAVAKMAENAVGVYLKIPGQGQVYQRICGSRCGSGQGLLQAIQVSGDLHQITNRMSVDILFRSTESIPRTQFGSALQQLRSFVVPGPI